MNSKSTEIEAFLNWVLQNIPYLLPVRVLQQLVTSGFHQLMGGDS